jgi:acetoin utilization protein AcuB
VQGVSTETGLPVHQYPTVRQYMTPSPCTVPRDQAVTVAHRLMREHGIRHLPVMDGEAVVGVLSERDILLVESLPGVNPTDMRVEEAMAPDPYEVTPDAPLAEVVATLLQRRIGSAIIVDDGRVAGVFTTVDALRALAELLAKGD